MLKHFISITKGVALLHIDITTLCSSWGHRPWCESTYKAHTPHHTTPHKHRMTQLFTLLYANVKEKILGQNKEENTMYCTHLSA